MKELKYTVTDMISTVKTLYTGPVASTCDDYKEFITTYIYQISTPSIATYETLVGELVFSHVTEYPPISSILYDYEDCPYGYSGQTELTSLEIITYLSRQRFTDGIWNFATSAACTPIYVVSEAVSTVSAFYDNIDKRCPGKYTESIFTYTYDVSTPILNIFETLCSTDMKLSEVECFQPTSKILNDLVECPYGYSGYTNSSALEYTTPLSKLSFIEGGWVHISSAACVPIYTVSQGTSTTILYYNNRTGNAYCHKPYSESIMTYTYDISTPLLNIFDVITSETLELVDVECFEPVEGISSWLTPCPSGYIGTMEISAKTYTTHFSNITYLAEPDTWVVISSAECVPWPDEKTEAVPLAGIMRNNNGHMVVPLGCSYSGISKSFNMGPQGKIFYSHLAPKGTEPVKMGGDYNNIPTLLSDRYTVREQTACASIRSSRYSVITAKGFEYGYEPLNGLVIEGILINSVNDFSHIPPGYNMPNGISSYEGLLSYLNGRGWWKGLDSRCYYELWATLPNSNTADLKLYSIPFLHSLYGNKGGYQSMGYKSYVWIRISRNGMVLHNGLHTATAETVFSVSLNSV